MDDIFNIREQLEHPRPPQKVMENVLQHWIDIVQERRSVEEFMSQPITKPVIESMLQADFDPNYVPREPNVVMIRR